MDTWLTLLSHWQDAKFRTGLTVPFLVGACRSPFGSIQPESPRSAILSLLNLVAAAKPPENGYWNFNHCPNIDELVITRSKNAVPPGSAVNVTGSDGSETSLYANFKGNDGLSTVELLADFFSEKYANCIDEGRFSKNGGKFTKFVDYDETWVKSALAVGG